MTTRATRACRILLGACCIGSLALYLLVAYPAIRANIDNFFYDLWLTAHPPGQTSGKVAIIDIDEASLRTIGQLPWPRSIVGDLVNSLLANGAEAVALDIWLTEPDRSSPIVVDGLLEKNFGLNLDLANIPPVALDNDRYLREVIKDKPVVLGSYAAFDNKTYIDGALPEGAKIREETISGSLSARQTLAQATAIVPPLPILAQAAHTGIMNVLTDTDGVVRALPLLIQKEDAIYPSLALRAVMAALDREIIRLKSGESGPMLAQVGSLSIPLEKDGSFHPVYRGPARSLPYFRAIDVIEGNVGRKELEGKILFVGPSAHTSLNLHSTPFDPEVPSPEIHATVADNILSAAYLVPPPHELAIQASVIYLVAILSILAFSSLSIVAYAAIGTGILVCSLMGSWLLFQNGILLSPAPPTVTLLLAAMAILPVRYWHEQTERQKLRHAFGRYVAPGVISQIMTDGDQLLKGEQKEVTVLFTDVRNFTAIAEKLSPTQLVRLLNFYFTPLTSCVTAHKGTLDKFIGDALMAFWNAPLNIQNHPAEAVAAAIEMQNALLKLQPVLKQEFSISMKMGIGINSGPAHVGNMGSEELLDYTCIGETVNIASRLEGLCKYYGIGIIVSESVQKSSASTFEFLLLDQISVKGSEKPLKIFTPYGFTAPDYESFPQGWSKALSAYFAGDFAAAKEEFTSLQAPPGFEAASMLFSGRCEYMMKNPVEAWTGIWNFKIK